MNNKRSLVAIDAERFTIASMIIDNSLIEDIGAMLNASDFTEADLAEIFNLVLALKAEGKLADIVTISDFKPVLSSGNNTLLVAGECCRELISTARAMTYAKIVKDRSEARRIYKLGQEILELSTESKPVNELIASVQNKALSLNSEDEGLEVTNIVDSLLPVIDNIDDNFNGRGVQGLKTGLVDLDKIIKGFEPANYIVIAGRPGMGKTTLGMNIAEHVAIQDNKSVLIFSLEMSKRALTKRILSSVSIISGDDINTGEAVGTQENISKLEVASCKLKKADIRICDKPALKIGRIRTIARFQHKIKPLDMVVIDYIGLIKPDNEKKVTNRNLELGEISHEIVAMAKELNIPVIVLAQLNRSIEKRASQKPVLSDLRDSGEIEQDADIIIFVHRENDEKGQNGITLIDVAKHRNSEIDYCYLQHQGMYSRFVSCAYQPSRDPEPPKKIKSAKSLISSFKPKVVGE